MCIRDSHSFAHQLGKSLSTAKARGYTKTDFRLDVYKRPFYDNEFGYSSKVLELIKYMNKVDTSSLA